MRSLIFEGDTWAQYEDLRRRNRRLHDNLRRIIKELLRDDPSKGLGKPEPLRHNLQGLWSRRLSQSDRVVYTYTEDAIHILAIGGHYERLGR